MADFPLSGFTGTYRDPVTLGYPLGNGYRWYLPWLMRFSAPDVDSPFGSGGFNPYAYCGADPANRTDPSGHFSVNVVSAAFKRLATGAEISRADSHTVDSPIATTSAAVPDTTEAMSLTSREQQLASTAFHHWHGLVKAHVQRLADLEKRLASMGKPVKTVDEFFEHLRSGRVVAQVNIKGKVESGHSVLYFNQGQHELMRDAAGSIDTPYQAKYSKDGFRNYIYSRHPLDAAYRSLLRSKVEHFVQKGQLHVLDEKYSEHITLAFEQERQAFTELPYSFGMRYNCHRFVFETLSRLLDLTA